MVGRGGFIREEKFCVRLGLRRGVDGMGRDLLGQSDMGGQIEEVDGRRKGVDL